jgi:hypothetical protein
LENHRGRFNLALRRHRRRLQPGTDLRHPRSPHQPALLPQPGDGAGSGSP